MSSSSISRLLPVTALALLAATPAFAQQKLVMEVDLVNDGPVTLIVDSKGKQ